MTVAERHEASRRQEQQLRKNAARLRADAERLTASLPLKQSRTAARYRKIADQLEVEADQLRVARAIEKKYGRMPENQCRFSASAVSSKSGADGGKRAKSRSKSSRSK